MEFLAGLHPRIVHFPIVMFTLYFFFELFGIILKKENLSVTAYIILIVGVITALGAVLTGNQAETIAESLLHNNNSLKDLIELHQDYATAVLWFFAGTLVLRTYLMLKKKFTGKLKYIFIVLGLVGCWLVYMAGNIGGNLVFTHGIGTQLFGK